MITDGTLIARIKKIHPSLTDADFDLFRGTILITDNVDGKGAYIDTWNHPSLTKPTDDAIKAVTL
tara:strand:+ start:288 stop:482 length:195 start_codon:yes stop_codon:yes gene_type:complete